MAEDFKFETTLKTKPENSFLNLQQYLFITSKPITRFFYYTKVTPHQVILLSMILGIAASFMIINSNYIIVICGAILLFYKNVLDKVDGSLARAKALDSRRGRFYDSISDFIVTFTSFSAISYWLYIKLLSPLAFIIGYSAMIISMLQCSFFIYYQVSFIIISGKSTVNRLNEKITDDDLLIQDKWTTFLQRIFLVIYGWQDKLFYKIDKYLLKKISPKTPSNSILAKQNLETIWYTNKPFLTMASSLSIGTHIFLICISALAGTFYYYFFVNLILMNLLLILYIFYHYRSVLNLLKT